MSPEIARNADIGLLRSRQSCRLWLTPWQGHCERKYFTGWAKIVFSFHSGTIRPLHYSATTWWLRTKPADRDFFIDYQHAIERTFRQRPFARLSAMRHLKRYASLRVVVRPELQASGYNFRRPWTGTHEQEQIFSLLDGHA